MHFRRQPSLHRYIAALGLWAAGAGASCAASETVIYNFGVVAGGRYPQAALTRAPDGTYYGTATSGGTSGNGVVFKLSPPLVGQLAWTKTIIHAFSGAADGAAPSSGLVLDSDGALFGVTASGGAQASGVAYKLTPPGPGQDNWTETTLHSFNGTSDGVAPLGTLVPDGAGGFYGSTAGGGVAGGVIFRLSPPPLGQTAWTETALYSFQSAQDGVSPSGGLFLDAGSGAIFGMTSVGGLNGLGQVYKLAPGAGAAWTKTALYDFRGITDGDYPAGALVRSPDGVFHGVTFGGGLSGSGTVFSLEPPQAGHKGWLETVTYHFTGRLDGGSPDATPVLGPDGTLYGTTNGGGHVGSGTVFALSPPAHGHTGAETALASFDGANGTGPAGLTLDPSGFLIGTTIYGGTGGAGTVFTLTPPSPGSQGWVQTEVAQFEQTSRNAASPAGALLTGPNGVLYGSASAGGAQGQGAVFQLTPPAGHAAAWHATVLHSFNGHDGAEPTGNLLAGPGGVLYGITSLGGPGSAGGFGTVYALLPPQPGQTLWTEQVLHAFTGVATGDGAYPTGGLIADATGALYGTAGSGGRPTADNTFGNGIVYKLAPPAGGHGAWKETILYAFSGPDGSTPQGALAADSAGALYGTTYVGGSAGEGTVYRLTPPAAGSALWAESVLHSFNASVGGDGAIPGAEQLLIGHDGALFGTASQGGALNQGAVFRLAPPVAGGSAWTETLIHAFTGTDGADPFVGLTAGGHGVLYGVAAQGGTPPGCQSPFGSGCGTVFKLTPPASGAAWAYQVLHDFVPAYGSDGGQPSGALTRGRNGILFGTTAGGGYGGGGVAYDISP